MGEYSKTLSLHITELRGDDFGAYTCVAANQFGTAVENMFVYGMFICIKKKMRLSFQSNIPKSHKIYACAVIFGLGTV